MVLCDTIGCIVGGSTTDIARAAFGTFEMCAGRGRSTLLGASETTDPVTAAHYHAILSDALDFEDTLVAHPSAAVIPTALAVGEQVGADGRDLVTAIVVGYEIGTRVAKAIMPSAAGERGRPVRYSWLGVAAAATAAKLLGLERDAFDHAIAYAAASSPVPLWISKLPRPLHYLKNNFGEQTRIGVWGALMAASGFVSPRGLFDGLAGYAHMLGSDRFSPAPLSERLGSSFHILDTTYKPYPACRYIHTTLDAIADIRRDEPFDWAQVSAVHVCSFSEMTDWFSDAEPSTIVDAEFSVPYAVAVMLMGLPVGPGWYAPDVFHSPAVRALAGIVTLESTPEHDTLFSDERVYRADVSIELRSGRTLRGTCSVPRGDTRRPLSEDDLRAKFEVQLVAAGVSPSSANRVWRLGRNAHEVSAIDALLAPLRKEVLPPDRSLGTAPNKIP